MDKVKILLVVLVIAGIVGGAWWFFMKKDSDSNLPSNDTNVTEETTPELNENEDIVIDSPTASPSGIQVSEEEKQKIDVWLKENKLNEYGDPEDTAYIGGSPLFDESTGQSKDRYQYIIESYPEKSWNK